MEVLYGCLLTFLDLGDCGGGECGDFRIPFSAGSSPSESGLDRWEKIKCFKPLKNI